MIDFIFLILAVIGTLCGIGNWVRVLDVFSHFQMWLTPALLIGFFFSSSSHHRFIPLWLLVLFVYHLLIIISYLPKPIVSSKPESAETCLTVLQYNMNANNSSYKLIINRIAEISPDILVICEANHHLLDRMTHLHETYPYRISAARWPNQTIIGVSGTILWSKFPFLSNESITLEKAHIQILHAIIQFGESPTQVIAAHLPSPVTSLQTRRRNDGMQEIKNLLSDKMPTLVIGDFNNTVWAAGMRKFIRTTHLQSVYRAQGIKATWPSATYPIGLSIDHIFFSKEWTVLKTESLDGCGSDHRMLFSKFTIPKTS